MVKVADILLKDGLIESLSDVESDVVADNSEIHSSNRLRENSEECYGTHGNSVVRNFIFNDVFSSFFDRYLDRFL